MVEELWPRLEDHLALVALPVVAVAAEHGLRGRVQHRGGLRLDLSLDDIWRLELIL